MQKLTLAELAAESVEMLPGRETLLFNFNASLIEAQNAGELAPDADAGQLAAFFWIGWEGAVLRAKLEQTDRPLQVFAGFFFASLPHG